MDSFSVAKLSEDAGDHRVTDQKPTHFFRPPIPPPSPPPPCPPYPRVERAIPPCNQLLANILKFFSLPLSQHRFPFPMTPFIPPPLPLFPTHQVPLSTCLADKETPLDLSRKAAAVSTTQRKAVRHVGSRLSHPYSYQHHHHHGSGKQPIPRCFECKRLFPSLWDLNAHFLREHQSSLQREFAQNRSWKTCSLENISVQQLQATLRRGSVERTGYPCPHCDYFAKWPTELQKHVMVHSKERPHQCIICGLTYKWKWDLGRHFDKSHHHAMNPYKKTCLAVRAAAGKKKQKSGEVVKKKRLGRRVIQRKPATTVPVGMELPLPPFGPTFPGGAFRG